MGFSNFLKELDEKMDLHLDQGGFHRWLGKREDEPITDADIERGLNSSDPHARKMAQFVKNSRSWHHGK